MVKSFEPIARADARVLVLGTMPGAESLRTGQYYAHPRNLFWPLVVEVLGLDSTLAYDKRCEALREAKVALWDVLEHCERKGSLDSAIKNATPNNFDVFLSAHPKIERVYFNGMTAEAIFKRRVELPPSHQLRFEPLPSTSPANTSLTRAAKLSAWRAIA